MTVIHELIPVEADRLEAAKRLMDEAANTFTKRGDHFSGHSRVVEMYTEDRESENTSDVKDVVTTVGAKLDHVWSALAEAMDVTATKELSNCSSAARADVVINGEAILEQVPATALLGLERRLARLRELYNVIPTLDPSQTWEVDQAQGLEGVFVTRHPTETQRTEKTMEHKVLYQATEHHPAQVESYMIDRPVGKITTRKFSGMVPPATKARWLRRIGQLLMATKEARQRANMAVVQEMKVGERLADFIHGE